MCMEENIFSRCTYEFFRKGMPAPEKRVYILRCGCSPYDALDQVEENYRYDAPDLCDTRVTTRNVVRDDRGGKYPVARSIEYIDQSGDIIFKVFNMKADNQQYSMAYLLEHSELLPNANVESFKAAYAHYDKIKSEGWVCDEAH